MCRGRLTRKIGGNKSTEKKKKRKETLTKKQNGGGKGIKIPPKTVDV